MIAPGARSVIFECLPREIVFEIAEWMCPNKIVEGGLRNPLIAWMYSCRYINDFPWDELGYKIFAVFTRYPGKVLLKASEIHVKFSKDLELCESFPESLLHITVNMMTEREYRLWWMDKLPQWMETVTIIVETEEMANSICTYIREHVGPYIPEANYLVALRDVMGDKFKEHEFFPYRNRKRARTVATDTDAYELDEYQFDEYETDESQPDELNYKKRWNPIVPVQTPASDIIDPHSIMLDMLPVVPYEAHDYFDSYK